MDLRVSRHRMHLVVPMAGGGTRFAGRGFAAPKPLIEIAGEPFFFWSVRSLDKHVGFSSIVFVTLEEHVTRYAIDRRIRARFPEARLVVLSETPPGATHTCLAGAAVLPAGEAVIFNDCDHAFRSVAFERFWGGPGGGMSPPRPDGVLLTFKASVPLYSFVAYGEDGRIAGTAEKKVVSQDAICGAYWFRDKETFQKAARRHLENCRGEECFVSGVFNQILAAGGEVQALETDFHIPFGTPEEYRAAQASTVSLQRLESLR